MPIRTFTPRWRRLGRVTAGKRVPVAKPRAGGPTTRPATTERLVVSADRAELLEPWTARYGGTVERNPREDEERYFAELDTNAVTVILPRGRAEHLWSQYFELWGGGILLRECDGIDCVRHRLEPAQGEYIGRMSDRPVPCICATEADPDDDTTRACTPRTRVFVYPIEVGDDIPDVGVWAVESGAWGSAYELAGDLSTLAAMLGHNLAGAPLRLSVGQYKTRKGDRPRLSLGLATSPRIAGELAAERRRELEAGAAPGVGSSRAAGEFAAAPDEDDVLHEVEPDDDPFAGDEQQEPETSTQAASPVSGSQVDDAPASGDMRSHTPDSPTPVVIGSLEVAYAGPMPAGPPARGPQLTILRRQMGDLALTDGAIEPIVRAYYDAPAGELTVAGAQQLGAWLAAEIKSRAAMAKR